jgi:hypothetical protein
MMERKKMAKACLPIEFEQSYLSYHSYPKNLILSGTKNYHSTLESYKKRLDEVEACLCLVDEKDVDVPIRDLHDGLRTIQIPTLKFPRNADS